MQEKLNKKYKVLKKEESLYQYEDKFFMKIFKN
jgi:hypothetical protein